MSSAPTAIAATSTTIVTLPPSLALISNFHSLVNIKLDGSNYLLWRAQVESVLEANGFSGYLDGSIVAPSSQIRNDQGEFSLNPEYSLWKLIDSQLRSCITASISQTTLPYDLGLRSVHHIWTSLSNRYNLLTETHVQQLRDQLYNLSKISTIDAYIDKIKELAQQLTAAGSPVEDDELVFRALHGLPKGFNGLRTAVRTKGHNVSFDELVTMMKSEDAQLSKDSTSDSEVSTSSVLLAAHGTQLATSSTSGPSLPTMSSGQYDSLSQNPHNLGYVNQSGQNPSYGFSNQAANLFGVSTPFGSSVVYPPFGNSQFGLPQFGVPHYGVQQFGPPQIGFNQQFGSPQLGFNQFGTSLIGSQPAGTQLFGSFRGFSRGRGRGPRMPCDICGRSNHSTNYCYYKPPQLGFPSQFSSQVSWRGPGSSTQWGTSGGIPMFQPPQTFPSRPSASQLSIPASQTVGTPQANLAAFSDNLSAMHITSSSGIPSGSSQNIIHPSTAFHLSSNLPQMASSSVQTAVTTPQSHPWFFDSGATNHITNNVQNLTNPQPAGFSNGVLVGNGTNLQVSHTGKGQDFSQDLVQGSMSSGLVSHSELF